MPSLKCPIDPFCHASHHSCGRPWQSMRGMQSRRHEVWSRAGQRSGLLLAYGTSTSLLLCPETISLQMSEATQAVRSCQDVCRADVDR